jgi:hypothetical protein
VRPTSSRRLKLARSLALRAARRVSTRRGRRVRRVLAGRAGGGAAPEEGTLGVEEVGRGGAEVIERIAGRTAVRVRVRDAGARVRHLPRLAELGLGHRLCAAVGVGNVGPALLVVLRERVALDHRVDGGDVVQLGLAEDARERRDRGLQLREVLARLRCALLRDARIVELLERRLARGAAFALARVEHVDPARASRLRFSNPAKGRLLRGTTGDDV